MMRPSFGFVQKITSSASSLNMQIGHLKLDNPIILAPMAGVTDRPFRELCKKLGAGATVSEMTAANPKLWNTRKSRLRRDHEGEPGIKWVQIAGAEPEMMAAAAIYNVEQGAEVIDINMGCPAKKVCKKAAGSALLADPGLVEGICQAVVDSVDVPVTLKIRTGTSPEHRNALEIARIALRSGIACLSIHGRTRAEKYMGEAEYQTIREVREIFDRPLVANGDVDSPEKAKYVLEHTKADGLMIGRSAQGRPWIFREINHYLNEGKLAKPVDIAEVAYIMHSHIEHLHRFYGEHQGLRIARKHVGWYLAEHPEAAQFKREFNRITCAETQLRALSNWFELQGLKKAG